MAASSRSVLVESAVRMGIEEEEVELVEPLRFAETETSGSGVDVVLGTVDVFAGLMVLVLCSGQTFSPRAAAIVARRTTGYDQSWRLLIPTYFKKTEKVVKMCIRTTGPGRVTALHLYAYG